MVKLNRIKRERKRNLAARKRSGHDSVAPPRVDNRVGPYRRNQLDDVVSVADVHLLIVESPKRLGPEVFTTVRSRLLRSCQRLNFNHYA